MLRVDAAVVGAVLLALFAGANGQDRPTTGLYFTLGDKVYLNGDTVFIGDIGEQPSNRADPGSTLVCDTSNVNTQCCRGGDNPNGGAFGNLLAPGGLFVPGFRSIGSNSDTFYLVRYTHQLRLGKRGSPSGGLGSYTCAVTDSTGAPISAIITITDVIATTMVTTTVQEPTSRKPTTMEPTTMKPTTMEPTTMKPTTMEPTTMKPTTMEPTTMEPTTMEPTTMEPTTMEPTTMEPTTMELTTMEPTTVEPTTVEPTTMTPELTTMESTTMNPTTIAESTTMGSSTMKSTTKAPSTMVLSTERLSTIMLATSSAGTTEASTSEVPNKTEEIQTAAITATTMVSTPFEPEETTMSGDVSTAISVEPTTPTVSVPSTPANVIAVPQTTSVTLSWTQSSLDDVTNYDITYTKTVGCPDAPSGTRTADGSPFNITGLQENTQYEITIIARNSLGMSPSADTTILTLSAVPTCCIPKPELLLMTATSFTVSWNREPCRSRNGEVRHYEARYFLNGSSEVIKSATIALDNRNYTATSLNSRSTYRFEVALVNEIGAGPYSSIIITTPALPLTGYLGSVAYSNNSMVTISNIGLGDEALIIFSDVVVSASEGTLIGTWRFPNNDLVSSNSSATAEFFTSGSSNDLLLNRPPGVTGPSGIFTVEIPNSNSVKQELYFGIYASNEGTAVISSLTYNITTGVLTCVSTGGPATIVTWSRSGPSYQQSKIVVDTVTATYHNLLSISGSQISDYNGTFTCTVGNGQGTMSKVTGEIKDIEISGFQDTYAIGSSASVSCYSNFTMVSIKWTASSSEISYKSDVIGSQEVVLKIEVLSKEYDDTEFFCDASYVLPSGSTMNGRKSFKLRVEEDRKSTMDIKQEELRRGGNTRAIIIGVVVGAIAALVILCVTIFIIILIVVSKRRKSSYDLNQPSKTDNPQDEFKEFERADNNVTVAQPEESSNNGVTTTHHEESNIDFHKDESPAIASATDNEEKHSEMKLSDDDIKEHSDVEFESV